MLIEIKNILLPLTGADDLDSVMSVALDFARRFDAHLSAVVVGSDPTEVATLAGEGISAGMVTEMIDAAATEAHRRAIRIRHSFDSFVHNNGLRRVEASKIGMSIGGGVSASLEVLDGTEHDALTWRSRLADMTLVPNLISATDPRASETLHAILFDSGRPLVIAPPIAPKTVGSRIAIAWNGTPESSLALRCILPWAHTAEGVQVLTCQEYQRRGPTGDDVVRYLRLHGISATTRACDPINKDVGAGLLKGAEDFGADMLSMGAYSHSRLRQMILGGVTRHILENMKLTVLMSR
ncbi:universal stress protein [Gluconobacter cerinus]|uniref:Universal stress protein UspA n=1 Tax=Gluconobacter cerinus TaxID=38307 RepID=A0AAV5NG23_9PROT|nr:MULTISPECIES: universal stress protein [Gluconobacter]MBM3098439.1 universal stress protein [Gluconobacter cerinus]MBS0981677.1 universal stress protein [Gluconobacter cerinus]MBS0993652.1 universal stress protein [Gluconobacter cerinus]MBS1017951.1 universal stress protein [Gluconobacter cerinus]MBS1021110.1 universal stress protein [Gluconobacter cerinus]